MKKVISLRQRALAAASAEFRYMRLQNPRAGEMCRILNESAHLGTALIEFRDGTRLIVFQDTIAQKVA